MGHPRLRDGRSVWPRQLAPDRPASGQAGRDARARVRRAAGPLRAAACRACLLAVLGLAWGALAEAAPEMKLNVDCEIGWQGCYRPFQWTPVDIDIHSAEKTFEAELSLRGQQDELSAMTVVHRGVVSPDTPYRAPLVTKFDFGIPECTLQIRNAGDGRVWQAVYSLASWQPGAQALTPVGAADLLLVFTGKGGFGLRQLPKAAVARLAAERPNDPATAGKVHVKERQTARLPWDWTAYGAVDLLILYDPDWSAMRDQQKAALVEWISGGGRALVILGGRPLVPGDQIARLLPLKVGDARRLDLPDGAVRSWGCGSTPTRAVTCWSLEGRGAAGWQFRSYGADQPLFASGPVGFGRVGVLAFDPSVMGGPQAENLVPFWVEFTAGLLDGPAIAPKPATAQEDDGGNYGYPYGYGYDRSLQATNSVLNFILDIPEMRPISIIWVILLLVGLAAVIGPVDYVILRRRDRLPLTWLTFALYIGVFSVLAYLGVRVLRAGDTQLRAVSVCDAIEGHGLGWVSVYSGIFASDTADYKLEGVDRTEWWSAVAPYAGGYHGYGGRSGSRLIACAQQDGGSRPVYLPISIWSMQCLLAEHTCAEMPIAARLERRGTRVIGTIENRAGVPVTRGCIRLADNWVIAFQEIPAKGTLAIDEVPLASPAPPRPAENRRPWRVWLAGVQEEQEPFRPEQAYLAKDVAKRTGAIDAYLAGGAAVVFAEYDRAPLGFRVAGRPCKVAHKRLVRLVVFPEKGPPE